MLFYLLFSAFVIHRKLGIVVFALWSLGALCHGFFDEYPLNFVFSSMHLRIVAGVVLCYLFQTYRLPLPRWTLAVGIVLFALTGIGREWGSLSAWEGIAGATLSSVMVIGGCAEADRSGLLRAPGWLVYLGNATYSIYLVHFFALSAIAKVVKASQLDAVVPTLPLFLLHVLCSVGVGCMCYQFLEKPLCEWAKLRFRDAKSQSAAVGAPALHPARKAA
jgi:peptidoglycan/LPS O-acetylase OafA/YrhL